jgi:hypothetical protein
MGRMSSLQRDQEIAVESRVHQRAGAQQKTSMDVRDPQIEPNRYILG